VLYLTSNKKRFKKRTKNKRKLSRISQRKRKESSRRKEKEVGKVYNSANFQISNN
jgi:hypothetical protein